MSVLCASLLIFIVVQLTPGDIAEIHSLSAATVERLNLDKPAWHLYLIWLGNSLRLDFGISLTHGVAVQTLLLKYAGTTLMLTFGSVLLSLIISVPLAVMLGLSPESRRGKWVSTLVYGFTSIPVFVVGYIVLAIVFGVFKFYPLDPPTGSFSFWPWFSYYILPMVVLALGNGTIGEFVRVLSLEIRNVNYSLYIRAARARGVSLLPHFLRPVIIPFISVINSRIAVLLGGVVVVERIFNRHGLGWLTWEATLNRDFFVVMAVTLVMATFIRLFMLMHDILSYFLDPRLRV